MKNFEVKQKFEFEAEKFTKPSITRPSEVLTIKEMLIRFASGREVKVDNSRSGDYTGVEEVDDLTFIDKSTLASKTIKARKEAERAMQDVEAEKEQKIEKIVSEVNNDPITE